MWGGGPPFAAPSPALPTGHTRTGTVLHTTSAAAAEPGRAGPREGGLPKDNANLRGGTAHSRRRVRMHRMSHTTGCAGLRSWPAAAGRWRGADCSMANVGGPCGSPSPSLCCSLATVVGSRRRNCEYACKGRERTAADQLVIGACAEQGDLRAAYSIQRDYVCHHQHICVIQSGSQRPGKVYHSRPAPDRHLSPSAGASFAG